MLDILLFVGLSASSFCSIAVSFPGPTPERGVILARSTGDVESVPIPETQLYRRLPDSVRQAPAFRFIVIDSRGGPRRFRPGETFLVAPLGYDASCAAQPWSEENWTPVGAEVVFYHTETRLELNGESVQDVLGWHAPYPYGAFLKYEGHGRAPDDIGEWLTAREYFDLVSVLPPLRAEGGDRASRLAEIERVFLEGAPQWSTKFPGTEVLRRARAWAERGLLSNKGLLLTRKAWGPGALGLHLALRGRMMSHAAETQSR